MSVIRLDPYDYWTKIRELEAHEDYCPRRDAFNVTGLLQVLYCHRISSTLASVLQHVTPIVVLVSILSHSLVAIGSETATS